MVFQREKGFLWQLLLNIALLLSQSLSETLICEKVRQSSRDNLHFVQ